MEIKLGFLLLNYSFLFLQNYLVDFSFTVILWDFLFVGGGF